MARLPGRYLSGRVVEVMVAITVASIVCLLSGPYLYRLWRRERLRIAAREVHTLVVAARLKAVKLNELVVLWINPSTRLMMAWADAPPYNFIQDPGEPTILHVRLRTGNFFQAPDGDEVGGRDSVAFDTYNGDPEIADRIVFRSNGTLVAPQSPNSKTPTRPARYTATIPYGSVNCSSGDSCRGVYLTDRRLRGAGEKGNAFRVSVGDFGSLGRISILKWLPRSEGGNPGENNYVPPPWKWAD
jgi:hypothetical protein